MGLMGLQTVLVALHQLAQLLLDSEEPSLFGVPSNHLPMK